MILVPQAGKKPCRHVGCRNLTREQFCNEHYQDKHQYDKYRGSAAKRGYDSKWQKARAAFLYKHPLCEHCKIAGMLVAATVVDHIIPHKGDKALFWDSNNWQSLCKKHHDIKTVKEDGGFGR